MRFQGAEKVLRKPHARQGTLWSDSVQKIVPHQVAHDQIREADEASAALDSEVRNLFR